jgi:hypothetical protein
MTVGAIAALLAVASMSVAGVQAHAETVSDAAAPSGGAEVSVGGGEAGPSYKENRSMQRCAQGAVVGRQHSGDEQGESRLLCSSFIQVGGDIGTFFEQGKKRHVSPEIEESAGIEFVCPDDHFIVARFHFNDENGQTQYRCANIIGGYYGRYELRTVSSTWSALMNERDSNYTCPENELLTGRMHAGDENGRTKYQCSSLAVSEVSS